MKNSVARKLRQVPAGYLVVGVDSHKKRHAAVAMLQDFTTNRRAKFNNSREGFGEMLEWARAEMVRTGCRGIIFAIETGGQYWRNLAYFLDEKGVPFRLINQFTLKRRREGKDLNRRKNDFRDAQVAAELLCTGEFTETKLPQGVYAELRGSYSAYRRMVKERSRITNLLRGLLDNLFPEFTEVFKNPCGKTAMTVLSICPVPSVIAAMAQDKFVEMVRAGHQGRLMTRKLCALHYAAQTSVGVKSGAGSVALGVCPSNSFSQVQGL